MTRPSIDRPCPRIACERCGAAYDPRLTQFACPLCGLAAPGPDRSGAGPSPGARAIDDPDRRLVTIVAAATILNLLVLALLAVAVLHIRP